MFRHALIVSNVAPSKWSVRTKKQPHTLNFQLKHKFVHNTVIKTLGEIFHRTPFRPSVAALQSSLDWNDHTKPPRDPNMGCVPVMLCVCILSISYNGQF